MNKNMSSVTKGSCLCGKITFEIYGAFESLFFCHCQRCRKDTGSAHAANLFSTTARLVFLSGEDAVTTYQLPATRHQKSFCKHCGSAVPNLQAAGKLLVVPAGSLDSPVDIRPNAHICVDSRANWDPLSENIPVIGGLPG